MEKGQKPQHSDAGLIKDVKGNLLDTKTVDEFYNILCVELIHHVYEEHLKQDVEVSAHEEVLGIRQPVMN